jgi:hypothetical protein
LAALSLAVALLAFVLYRSHEQQREFRTQAASEAQQARDRISRLETRTATLEGVAARLGSETAAALQGAEQKLAASTRQLRAQQQEASKRLASLAEEQNGRAGALNNELSSVKGALDQTIEDVSTQRGLIALNHDQLQELKRRGEKDFLEFSLRKSKQPTRVGDVSLQLTRTDVKGRKYNMVVWANDLKLEKKDKTALEPVQFYLPGDRRLVEIVVWDVNKDQVAGYVSAPKGLVANARPDAPQ